MRPYVDPPWNGTEQILNECQTGQRAAGIHEKSPKLVSRGLVWELVGVPRGLVGTVLAKHMFALNVSKP